MREDDSAGRARLTWFSMKTLSTHPHTKTFGELAAAGCERVVWRRKGRMGNYNKTKRLATRQNPRRLGWRGMRLRWWDDGPSKGDDINPIENLWAILDERLESKKFTTEEWKKQSSNCGMKLICPSYITSLIPFQTVCEELGRPKEAQ